ncbi:FliM/FliN family flagellar motor switch protein [Paracoccus sp. SCSIO 75233]|uniref:FliM/FliN family flagellar motor switch protein n=1 Tax=Paracoccus sp. SCSIO 75233 TaxID=3017782 RepID=UPI0022F03CD0|nr:FliM/FliN family flagellar motor switch protein [Paracoccus sp. SCSIO 75233]WBU53320.1 FliM/FliN family flagellar motor switch protein [Paracoccus sp. SCSIO 75233]
MVKAAISEAPEHAVSPMGEATGVLRQYLARVKSRAADISPPVIVPRQTPDRAAAIAVGRAAQRACRMPVLPTAVRIGQSTLAEMPELLPDAPLILVVEDQHGALGVVALCGALLASVIESQSLGRVLPHPPRIRRATRTDASICADFVNILLAELSTEMTANGGDQTLGRFRFASFLEDARPLELMLEDIGYRTIRVAFRAGEGGVRDCALTCFLPGGCDVPPPQRPHASDELRHGDQPSLVTGTLARAVRSAPITLRAVLCRRRIPLRELKQVKPGSLISLPRDAIDLLSLETASGMPVLRGRLGKLHGSHAMRIRAVGDVGATTMPDASDMVGSGANLFEESLIADDFPDTETAEPPIGDLDHDDSFRNGDAQGSSAAAQMDAEPAPGAAEDRGEVIGLPLNILAD